MADREVLVTLKDGEFVISAASSRALTKPLLEYLNRPEEQGNSATE